MQDSRVDADRKQLLIKRIMSRFDTLRSEKALFNTVFDFIAQYVLLREGNFSAGDQITPSYGNFVPYKVFDSTATKATYNLASALIGNIFPSGGKTFQLRPPLAMPAELAQSDEVKNWYEQATIVNQQTFDDPTAGFQSVLRAYFTDQAAFGTSGIAAFDDTDYEVSRTGICFESIDAKRCWISEGRHGLVDSIYRIRIRSLHQLEEEYTFDALPSSIQEKLLEGKIDDKKRVLITMEPRKDRIHKNDGNDSMPIAATHILLDDGPTILKESGYPDQPGFIGRFWKWDTEVWGRSPATTALPEIMEINSTRQAAIVAVEKHLDPPLWVRENSVLGGGVVDTSAGAINVAKQTGRPGENPINVLVTVGELQSTYGRMTEIQNDIEEIYLTDKLISLQGDQRMTLGEAQIRNEERRQSLGIIFALQLAEVFTPLIGRVFNINWLNNRMGVVRYSREYWTLKILNGGAEPFVIPDAVVNLARTGQDVYRIVYLSPAARTLRQEELNGIMQMVQTYVEVAPVDPGVTDELNWGRTFKAIHDLTGATTDILNSTEEKQQSRTAKMQQQQALQKAELESQAALTAKHGAQAAEAAAKAQSTRIGGLIGG